ncbi:peptide deformylase [Roseivivax isoporae]|uniref:Peptide deformylase n=1 Tax=Roseivivax isoporae LMG 25204 TaxID=1449351 RepID=X7F6S7_9RHOB|nr:peptide deformylase [Roseivivax isoporae]ETX27806.1 N-formylmethionyl-tRNA deformylase [Roseivivax isoporae LMG 25204]
MSVLPILTWPDARLATSCAIVDDPATVETLVRDLFETMYDAPGRGLAAPQVGVLDRVFVMDAGWKDGEMTPRACINPEIVAASGTFARHDEGCLSIPGIAVPVARPDRVTLRYTGIDGVRHEVDLAGAEALVAQHELDHLDGIVTFDRTDPALRDDLIARFRAAR